MDKTEQQDQDTKTSMADEHAQMLTVPADSAVAAPTTHPHR